MESSHTFETNRSSTAIVRLGKQGVSPSPAAFFYRPHGRATQKKPRARDTGLRRDGGFALVGQPPPKRPKSLNRATVGRIIRSPGRVCREPRLPNGIDHVGPRERPIYPHLCNFRERPVFRISGPSKPSDATGSTRPDQPRSTLRFASRVGEHSNGGHKHGRRSSIYCRNVYCSTSFLLCNTAFGFYNNFCCKIQC